jgi:N-hydroxyarylamine O-acetyltransferase
MDISLYLKRIRYTGPLEPTSAALRALQFSHLIAVPFENFDIHMGRKITLDVEALFDKIVLRRRGGFCYELNGLFGYLLEGLGFKVRLLSAGVFRGDGSAGPDFDHLTLQVHQEDVSEETWLADVGFGDSFLEPLLWQPHQEQAQGLRAYRLDQSESAWTLWQRNYDGQWEPQYRLTTIPRKLDDFTDMCNYHQSSPKSMFTRNKVCTIATMNGRITLEESRLISTVHGKRQVQMIEDESTYRRLLRQRFGIEL